MAETVKDWQIGNHFTVTLRGHQAGIPASDTTLTAGTYNPYINNDDISSEIREVAGTSNYNRKYDSFYCPADSKISCITIRMPKPLPIGSNLNVVVYRNSTILEKFKIPEGKRFNIKRFAADCSYIIWEDDFIEIEIESDNYESLTFNDNNPTMAFSFCANYYEYQDAYNDSDIEWESTDYWYKTTLHLQNRSGDDIITNRIFFDQVKSPTPFLIQGVRLCMFRDEFMVGDRIERSENCFFVDILVNGKSILETLNFDRPIQIDDSTLNLNNYELSSFDNVNGYPVKIGDDVVVKVYQRNNNATYNGKLLCVELYGCSPSCISNVTETVKKFTKCDDEDCVWAFEETETCDPDAVVDDPEQDQIIPSSSSSQSERDYVTLNGQYVTINGEKIWI